MFASSERFYLGHFGPVPVYVAVDAIFLVFVVVYKYQALTIPHIVTALIVFILAILLHELGHAVAALAQRMHSVSVTIGFLGGYCTYAGERRPWQQVIISLAGPLTNFALAAIAWQVATHVTIDNPIFHFFLAETFFWNLVLGIFNLLPIYPFDGGQATLGAVYGITRRDRFAKSTTLGITVVTAVVVLVALTWLNGGTPPIITLPIILFAVFIAFRDLR